MNQVSEQQPNKSPQHGHTALPEDAPLPKISIVIITKKRRAQAEAAAASVLADTYPHDCRELIVLEETSRPRPMQGRNLRYHTLPEANKGFAFARNQALALAAHGIIAFTDDDCIVAPGWLKALVAPFLELPAGNSKQVSAVAGAVLLPPCGPIGECENILGFPGGGVKYVHMTANRLTDWTTFSTCNCAILREAVITAGGFDETLRYGGEDERLAAQIAETGRIVFQPAAIVRHAPRDSLKEVWRWFVRRGTAKAEAIKSNPAPRQTILTLLRNSPCLRIALLAGILGFCLGWFAIPALVCLMLLHAIFIVWRFRWASRYYPRLATRLLLPTVKITMDIAHDCGLIKGFFEIKRKTT